MFLEITRILMNFGGMHTTAPERFEKWSGTAEVETPKA